MGRLLDWPRDVGVTSWEPLSGPRAVGASSSESLTGYIQTVSAVYGVWRWQFALQPLRGQAFRRWRGFVAALHGGANAVRLPWMDADPLTPALLGIDPASVSIGPDGRAEFRETSWSNGQPWAHGLGWLSGPPVVGVAAAAVQSTTVVRLADEAWGPNLDIGDMFGFVGHFGVYTVTEWLADGEYRIWPPLRRAISTADVATLRPVIAMRLPGEDAAKAGRALDAASGLTITLVEVEDPDVREYFAD